MLTRKQYQLLVYLQQYIQEKGVSPSFDEMREALDLKSKSGVHRLVSSLQERGFIRRLEHRARALEVVRLPENVTEKELPARNRRYETLQRRRVAHKGIGVPRAGDTVHLPLFGRIAAGTPIEALRDPSTMVEVPASLLGRGNHYALQVEGESMIEAGIMDGDTVIIEQTDTANNGEIVVAMIIDSREVTLKRLRRKGGEVALEPANHKYETRVYNPDQLNIQGRLIGLLRRY